MQLWTLHRGVVVNGHAVHDPTTNTFYPLPKSLPAIFSFRWPDNRPCLLVERYLQVRSKEVTVNKEDGGTLKVEVSHLSHLVRFCWFRKKDFWELTDQDFQDFVTGLMNEKHSNDMGRSKRNNNTIEQIIATSIRFLKWIQEHIFLDKIIVGTKDDNPNILLKKRIATDRRGKRTVCLKYHYLPPKSTQEPKKPISRNLRNKLWSAISQMSDPTIQSPYYANRFDHSELINELNYLKKRRELFLELLEATGARPGELAQVSVAENSKCTVSGKIILITLKRRTARKRRIPIDPGVAIKMELFIHKTRADLIARLGKLSGVIDSQDCLFLCSKKGTPLTKQSLTKEFQRIVSTAGIRDEQACASMFRHRFITNMVKIHLQAFLSDNKGTTRLLMNEGDYRTILKRVAVFTDHADENSLWHYIDLAWDELGIFDYVEPARRLACSVERSINNLTSLQGDIKLKSKLPVTQLIDIIISELESIRSDVKDALYTRTKLLQ